jgi:CRP/FNR family cyclic AMP-dependent transcriptional regulator
VAESITRNPVSNTLWAVSIFGGLNDETLSFLLGRAERVRVPKGQLFFREGDPGGTLYILQSGRAEVLKNRAGDATREPMRLAEIPAGGCFGEVSLLAVMPRSATVAAAEDCDALQLRYTDLHALYQKDVGQFALLVLNLGREVARRLWKSNQLLVDFAELKS